MVPVNNVRSMLTAGFVSGERGAAAGRRDSAGHPGQAGPAFAEGGSVE